MVVMLTDRTPLNREGMLVNNSKDTHRTVVEVKVEIKEEIKVVVVAPPPLHPQLLVNGLVLRMRMEQLTIITRVLGRVVGVSRLGLLR